MDNATLKAFRSDFAHAVADLERQYNVKLSLGTIRFDSNSFRTTMSALETKPVAKVVSMASGSHEEDYATSYIKKAALSNGFELNVGPSGFIGSKYKIPGKRSTYEVTGINTRAPKFCVQVRTESGAQYKMPVAALRSAVLVG